MTFFDDVGAFHRKFNLPHHGDGRPPQLTEADVLAFRLGFNAEEQAEFCRAYSRGDLAGCLDALVDNVYVLLGLAHFMALPFNEGWDEVQGKNMLKEPATDADDPRSKRNHRFDIVKPDGWTPPSHDAALERAAVRAFAFSSSARGMCFDDWLLSLQRRRTALGRVA